jgi:hypothetical protein
MQFHVEMFGPLVELEFWCQGKVDRSVEGMVRLLSRIENMQRVGRGYRYIYVYTPTISLPGQMFFHKVP